MENINEQIDRIKSLFTEERLYGNLITEAKTIIPKSNVVYPGIETNDKKVFYDVISKGDKGFVLRMDRNKAVERNNVANGLYKTDNSGLMDVWVDVLKNVLKINKENVLGREAKIVNVSDSGMVMGVETPDYFHTFSIENVGDKTINDPHKFFFNIKQTKKSKSGEPEQPEDKEADVNDVSKYTDDSKGVLNELCDKVGKSRIVDMVDKGSFQFCIWNSKKGKVVRGINIVNLDDTKLKKSLRQGTFHWGQGVEESIITELKNWRAQLADMDLDVTPLDGSYVSKKEPVVVDVLIKYRRK